MKKSVLLVIPLLITAMLLTSCNEPPNPLLGKWRQVSPPPVTDSTVEFTPSTMRMNGKAVTVVYQFRDDKVRVSASKHAIIYQLIDNNTVNYHDVDSGTVTLKRIRP